MSATAGPGWPLFEPMPFADLARLQLQHGVHICPSEREGFGHYINEARAAQAGAYGRGGWRGAQQVQGGADSGLLSLWASPSPSKPTSNMFITLCYACS